MNDATQSSGHKIKWGAIIAGAAIAAGVILFAPVIADKIPEYAGVIGAGLKEAAVGIGHWISGVFGGAAAPEAGAGFGKALAELGKALTGETARRVYGAGLIGAGATYFLKGKKEESMQPVEAESFAVREDIKRMQALMQARMMAQGYSPAMGGRGIA